NQGTKDHGGFLPSSFAAPSRILRNLTRAIRELSEERRKLPWPLNVLSMRLRLVGVVCPGKPLRYDAHGKASFPEDGHADGFRPILRRKVGVIGHAASVALLASLASADAAEVAICSLITKPSSFDRQALTFQGIARAVKKTTLRRGNDYTLFK